jgi:hypothetical protein
MKTATERHPRLAALILADKQAQAAAPRTLSSGEPANGWPVAGPVTRVRPEAPPEAPARQPDRLFQDFAPNAVGRERAVPQAFANRGDGAGPAVQAAVADAGRAVAGLFRKRQPDPALAGTAKKLGPRATGAGQPPTEGLGTSGTLADPAPTPPPPSARSGRKTASARHPELAARIMADKQAGFVSELLGNNLNPLNALAAPVSGVAALMTPTRTTERQAQNDSKSHYLRDLLVPGVAPYQAFKRLGYAIRGPDLQEQIARKQLDRAQKKLPAKKDAPKKDEPEKDDGKPKDDESEKTASARHPRLAALILTDLLSV